MEQSLCNLCRGLSTEHLTRPEGYQHAATVEELHESAKTCKMCQIIDTSLKENEPDDGAMSGALICRLHIPGESKEFKAALEVAGFRRHGFIRVYTHDHDAAERFGIEIKSGPDLDMSGSFLDVLAGGLVWTCISHHACGDPFRRLNVPAEPKEERSSTSHQKFQSLSNLIEDLAPGRSAHFEFGGPLPAVESEREIEHDAVEGQDHRGILDSMPARLIYLTAFSEEERADACLVEVRSLGRVHGDHAPYVALSYCWGQVSESLYKTTSATLQSRKDRIIWQELPRTFQDAFRIARRIRMPFLWIDAICIIQDSEEDWERESAKMGGIYATGFATIAADACKSVDEGFLDIPLEDGEENMPYLTKIENTREDGTQSNLVFWNATSAPPGETHTPPAIEQSPLSSRAWCMQERMLSARTLHFTKIGLIMECRERYSSVHMISTVDAATIDLTFAGILRCLEKGMKGGWGLSIPPIERLTSPEQLATMTDENFNLLHESTTTGSRGYSTYGRRNELEIGKQSDLVSFWNRTMMREYSGRKVTFDKDRLPAISGVARLFGEYIQSPYIAGLWLAELEEGLEWGRGGETWTNKKSANHPQFSWASHPGTVENPYLGNIRGYGRAFDIINYSVALSGNDAYGKITTAELILHGHIRLAHIHSDRITDVRRPYKIKRSLLSENDGIRIGEADLDMDYSMEELSQGVYCFLLYKHSFGYPRLLLLSKSGSEDSGVYLRIGIGIIQRSHASWLLDAEKRTINLR